MYIIGLLPFALYGLIWGIGKLEGFNLGDWFVVGIFLDCHYDQ